MSAVRAHLRVLRLPIALVHVRGLLVRDHALNEDLGGQDDPLLQAAALDLLLVELERVGVLHLAQLVAAHEKDAVDEDDDHTCNDLDPRECGQRERDERRRHHRFVPATAHSRERRRAAQRHGYRRQHAPTTPRKGAAAWFRCLDPAVARTWRRGGQARTWGRRGQRATCPSSS